MINKILISQLYIFKVAINIKDFDKNVLKNEGFFKLMELFYLFKMILFTNFSSVCRLSNALVASVDSAQFQ